MTENINIDTKTVKYMDKLQAELDMLKYAILSEDFEYQYRISGNIEKLAKEFREYKVEIADSK